MRADSAAAQVAAPLQPEARKIDVVMQREVAIEAAPDTMEQVEAEVQEEELEVEEVEKRVVAAGEEQQAAEEAAEPEVVAEAEAMASVAAELVVAAPIQIASMAAAHAIETDTVEAEAEVEAEALVVLAPRRAVTCHQQVAPAPLPVPAVPKTTTISMMTM